MASNRIYIQVNFQQAGAVAAVNQLNQSIASIGPTTQKASAQASQGVSSLNMQIRQAQSTFSGMQGAIAGLGLYNLGKQVLEATADIDTLRRGLNLWEGDTEKANQRFQQFIEMSKKAGVSLEPAINAYNRLRGAGQDAEESIKLVEGFGKALGQMGKSGPELSGALEQVTQSIAKGGRVMREDLKFVQQYVPQISKMMKERFGTADTEELAKRGHSAAQFWKVIGDEMMRLQEAEPGVRKMMDNFWTQMRLGMEGVGKSLVETLGPEMEKFLGYLKSWVEWWGKLEPGTREMIIQVTEFSIAVALVSKAIYGIVGAIEAVSLAAAANPVVLAILGITAGGMAIAISYQQQSARLDLLMKEQEVAEKTAAIIDRVATGQTLEGLKKIMGPGGKERMFSDEDIKKALGGTGQVGGFKYQPGGLESQIRIHRPLEKPDAPGKPDPAAKAAAESMKKWIESVNQKVAEALTDAVGDRQKQLAAAMPPAQAMAQQILALQTQRAKEWEDLITRVGPKGEKQKLPAKVQADLQVKFAEETAIRIGTIQDQYRQKIIEQNKKDLEEYGKAVLEKETELWERKWEFRVAVWEQEKELIQRTQDARLDIEMKGIEARRDMELAALEQLDDFTVQQKIENAQKRLEIEQRYVDQARSMSLMLLAVDKERELAQLRIQASIAKMLDSPEYKQAVAAIEQYYKVREEGIDADAQQKRDANRVKSIGDQSKMVRTELENTFKRFQTLADGVFDALLDKSKSVWQSMADFWKQAWLTAIKAVFSRLIATGMMRMLGMPVPAGAGAGGSGGGLGGLGGGGRAGGGGWLGSILGLGGMMGGGGFGWPGNNTGIIMNATGAGGSYGVGGGTGLSSGAGGGGGPMNALGLGGLAKGGGFMGMLRGLGGLGRGPTDLLGNKLGSIPGTAGAKVSGVGGAAGGAMLLGGAGLVVGGLYKGGWTGLGMTTAGGALIGAKFGGPLGAAIGAGAGFTAGLVRMMFKSGEEKTKNKIQEVYGVSIQSKDILKQIMRIAKDQFGGDMNVAVYSPAVRELVQMYTLATGQSAKNMPRPMYGVNMAQSGGQMTLQPVYSGGNIVANPYSGPTTQQWSQGTYVQLNPDQANALLEGRVVNILSMNPQAVNDAASDAASIGHNRQAGRQASSEPLTTLA